MARINNRSKLAAFGTVTTTGCDAIASMTHTPNTPTIDLGRIEEVRTTLEHDQRKVFIEVAYALTSNLAELQTFFRDTLSQYRSLIDSARSLDEVIQLRFPRSQWVVALGAELHMALTTNLRGVEKVNELLRELENTPFNFENSVLFPRMVDDIRHRMKHLNRAKPSSEEKLGKLLEHVEALNVWLAKNAAKVARDAVYIPAPQPKANEFPANGSYEIRG